jgi:preprotein translocase subunit SecF
LSIVRFRAAIKEPEELGFLFLAISIGLGLGASQPIITLVAFALISIIILFRHFSQKAEFTQNLLLTITSFNPQVATLEKISDILKRSFSRCQIKRFDETKEMIEVLFLVEFESFDQLEKVKTQIRQLDNSIKISFLDNRGVFLS